MRVLTLLIMLCLLSGCETQAEPVPEPVYDGPVDIFGDPIGPGSVVSLGEACGGMMGLRCDGADMGSTYCAYEPEAICGAADQLGQCAIAPVACPDINRPVCGCDGETYANACQARAARTSVVRLGPCEWRISDPADRD